MCLLNYPTYWDSATIVVKQVLLISNCLTTSPGGWVVAGEIKIKANSDFKLILSWGLTLV